MDKEVKALMKRAFIAGLQASAFHVSDGTEKMKEVKKEIHPLAKAYWKRFLEDIEHEDSLEKDA